MAQPSSAQREPSMEEILASIRRIIEDSDTVKKPAVFERRAPASRMVEDIQEPVFEPANSDVVSYLRPADIEPTDIEQANMEPADDRAAEADVEAPVAAVDQEPVEQEATIADQMLEPPLDLQDDFTVDFDELQAALDQSAEELSAPVFEDFPAEEPSTDNVTKTPLVSDMTGRQVAAAFGELSDAFAASRRKSFDEMAEEMLRPMLQEWLDDNLPTLVERLVREEIERVARGGAR